MNKLFAFSFAMLCCLCSVCFADKTGFEVGPRTYNYQNMPCSPSQFDVSSYVNILVQATRERDALAGSNPNAARDKYNAAFTAIENGIKEARRNQYRVARCSSEQTFHAWADEAPFYTKGRRSKDGDVVISPPDGAWELEVALPTRETARNRSAGGDIVYDNPAKREGNNAVVHVHVRGPWYGHVRTYVYGVAGGQYKLTDAYIEQKINEEIPFLMKRVVEQTGKQW